VAPDGPPFIRYLDIGERLEIELGVPVAEGVGALEGVGPSAPRLCGG
jgi:hypothetical protein